MKSNIPLVRPALLFVAILLLPAALNAQAPVQGPEPETYRTHGVLLGISLNGSSITVEDADHIDSGGGVAVRLGYGLTRRISLFAQGTGAAMRVSGQQVDNYVLGHADVGARILLSVRSTTMPYLEGAVSGRHFAYEVGGGFGTLEARGAAVTAGGGAEVFLSPRLALDLGIGVTVGEFTEGRIGGGSWTQFGADAFSATSARLNVGLLWRP